MDSPLKTETRRIVMTIDGEVIEMDITISWFDVVWDFANRLKRAKGDTAQDMGGAIKARRVVYPPSSYIRPDGSDIRGPEPPASRFY